MKIKEIKTKFNDIYVIAISDCHIGDRGFTKNSEKKLRGYIDWVKKNKNAYVIFNGDILNVATRESKTSPFEQNMDLAGQIDKAVELFKPIKDRIIGCVTDDTKLLTSEGWKYVKDTKVGDKILTFNKENNSFEYQKCEKVFDFPYKGDIYNYKNSAINFNVTPEHRILYKIYPIKDTKFRWNKTKGSEFRVKEARNFTSSLSHYSITISANFNGKGIDLTDDEIRLCAWIITEGTMPKSRRDIQIYQSVRHQQHIDSIKLLLKRLNINFKVYDYKGKGIGENHYGNQKDWISIYLRKRDSMKFRSILNCKKEIPRSWLNNMSQHQIRILFETMMDGDGHIYDDLHGCYYTSNRNLAEQFLELTLKNNQRARIVTRKRNGFISYEIPYSNFKSSNLRTKNFSKKIYNGRVYSIAVPNTFYLAMRDDKPFITGNSIDGNHENRISDFTGYSPTISICERLGISYLGDSAIYVFRLGCHSNKQSPRGSFTMYAHHCFDEQTEILTEKGWKKYNELEKNQMVMTFNIEKNKMEWNKINNIFIYNDFNKMIHFKNKETDLMVTDEHTLIRHIRNIKNLKYKKENAIECVNKENEFLTNGIINNKEYPINDNLLKLLAWTITEGTKFSNRNKAIRITQSDKPKVSHKHIISLIEKLSKKYETKINVRLKYKKGFKDGINRNYDAYEIYINKCKLNNIIKSLIPDKKIQDWMFNLSKRQFNLFLNELILGDGNIDKRDGCNNYSYSQKDKKDIDKLQAICSINGYRTILSKEKWGGYRLSITKRKYVRVKKNTAKIIPYKGKAWCVSVDNKTLLVRRNGKTMITGNSTGGGRSIGSKMNRVALLREIVANCDCYVSSHNHMLGVVHGVTQIVNSTTGKIETVRQLLIDSGGYLEWDESYAERNMLPPLRIGSPRIHFILKRGTNDEIKKDVHVSI